MAEVLGVEANLLEHSLSLHYLYLITTSLKHENDVKGKRVKQTIRKQMCEAIFMARITFDPSVNIDAIFAIKMCMTMI